MAIMDQAKQNSVEVDLDYEINQLLTQNKHNLLDERGQVYEQEGKLKFKDKGSKLLTKSNDLETIQDMLAIAEKKGWRHIKIKGNEEFRNLAFREAHNRGLNIINYDNTMNRSTQDQELVNEPIKKPTHDVQAQPELKKQHLESEAKSIQAQNEMPTKAQINTSPKADMDSDVRFGDIGSKSIPSELKGELKNWVNQFTNKQNGLDQPNKSLLVKMRTHAAKAISGMRSEHRTVAMRNYNENMDRSINGTTLNIPEHIKQQVEKTQDQSKEHTRKSPDLELEL